VQTCTVRDLQPEGADAPDEADPEAAALKAGAEMVKAIEPAVRRYERPPAEEMAVETHWSEVRLSADDWADAFDAAGLGTPHNEAREQIWDELVAIIAEKHDEDEIEEDLLRRSLARNRELTRAFDKAWPVIEPTDLVAALWAVPDFLRMCAPWLDEDQAALLYREDPKAWTTADLPLLDAARHRLGDPEASRRARRREAEIASERQVIDRVVEEILEAGDGNVEEMILLRGADLQDALVHYEDLEAPEPDLLAGPFAHVIVDEAQELTDAEWQMLLRRCPSRSFTIVGDRAQARHGFTESWSERLQRIGLNQVRLAALSINYRTPEEVMAEAEQVIRAAIPDANVPVSVRSSGVPVRHGSTGELEAILDAWLAAHADGTACVIGDAAFEATARVRSLTPELSKGLEFDLVVLIDPEEFGDGIEGAVDRYVAMTRATQQLVILTGR
jgi:superfamily I DNA/RNA helicase